MTINHLISRIVFTALFLTVISGGFNCLSIVLAAEAVKPQQRPGGDVITNQEPPTPQLKRVSENGGEVLIDGSLRVFETGYAKIFDLVEISTSVAAAPNHVRLYVVASGTYSVIKAQFDNGAVITLGNN